jgi:hypothetical protein
MNWLASVNKVIDNARTNELSELEMRIGIVKQNKRFEPGLSAEKWNIAVEALTEYGDWKEVTDWRVRTDFLFANSARMSRESNGDEMITTTIKKTRVKTADIPIEDSQMALRMASCVEQPALIEDALATPTLVRVKHIKSFTTTSGLRFDMSRVWQGASLSRLSDNSPQYEIELEVANREYLQHTNIYITKSMMMKMHDLIVA